MKGLASDDPRLIAFFDVGNGYGCKLRPPSIHPRCVEFENNPPKIKELCVDASPHIITLASYGNCRALTIVKFPDAPNLTRFRWAFTPSGCCSGRVRAPTGRSPIARSPP